MSATSEGFEERKARVLSLNKARDRVVWTQSAPGMYTLRYKTDPCQQHPTKPQDTPERPASQQQHRTSLPPTPYTPSRPASQMSSFRKDMRVKQLEVQNPEFRIRQKLATMRPSPNANYRMPHAVSPGYFASTHVGTDRGTGVSTSAHSKESNRKKFGTATENGRFDFATMSPRLGRFIQFGPTLVPNRVNRAMPDKDGMATHTPGVPPYLLSSWRRQRAKVKNELDQAHAAIRRAAT